jgi:hypothetical protein
MPVQTERRSRFGCRTAITAAAIIVTAVAACAANTGNDVQSRIDSDIAAGRPVVVHVVVALCDLDNQGVGWTTRTLGNGQDPGNNLYWGAMYGTRTFLINQAGWDLVDSEVVSNDGVLKSLLLHDRVERDGREADVYLIAEAWDGARMREALGRFLQIASGHSPCSLKIERGSDTIEVTAGGESHLVAFVGHNGLMDLQLDEYPEASNVAKPISAAVLCCHSYSFFQEPLNAARCHQLLLTTGLMAPEAYTLDAVARSWAGGGSADDVRESAARAYARYQKCGLGGARRLFRISP